MNTGDWNRGQKLDWHAHHFNKPPRGYEWREVDGNYVLAAITTGVIVSVIVATH
jgi:Ni/Co efflux regulator RcnB